MNLVVITGRMYNGAVHGWTDSDKQERSCFRGRLNFRLPNGDYEWIDAVCFKDNPNTDANGLVGWLEDNYLAPEDEADGHGGRAIEVSGWLKPTQKKKTITVNLKGGGKKDIPNVPYDTFELVIDTASFVPTSHGEGGRSNTGVDVDDDEDFDIDEDGGADDDMEVEDEVSSRRNRGNSNNRNSGNRNGSNRNSGSRGGSSRNSGGSRSDRRSGGSSNKSSRTGGNKTSGRKAAGADDEFFVED